MFTEILLAMANLAVQYAVVAFSMLLYSCQRNPSAEQYAFQFYQRTELELNLLSSDCTGSENHMLAIAASLQLASFDVFLLFTISLTNFSEFCAMGADLTT